MNSINLSRIEALNKENYDTWKMQMEALLIKNDAWQYVKGECKKPSLVAGDSISENNLKTWLNNDSKAKSDIILSISPSELKQIKGCETSHEVWLKLEGIYQSRGPARKATLLKQLTLQRMENDDDVREHINKFFDAVDKLGEMEVEINPDLLAIMLLYSLPSSFENFRCAIESRDDLPSPDILRVKIIEESDARKSDVRGTMQNAMVANKTYNKWRQSKKPQMGKNEYHGNFDMKEKFKFRCHRCRAVGHKAADCKSKGSYKPFVKSCENVSLGILDAFKAEPDHKLDNNFENIWCLDSGCTSHMCCKEEKLNDIVEIKNTTLNLANKTSTLVKGKGYVEIATYSRGPKCNVKLNNALYVPDLRMNLMSVSKITEKGFTVEFDNKHARIRNREGKIVITASKENNLYLIKEVNDEVNNTMETSNLQDWHERLGHLNERSLLDMVRCDAVRGMKIGLGGKLQPCETCCKGKMAQTQFPKNRSERTNDLLQIVHTDICGPMRKESIGGSKYFMTFIDDRSRWCQVKFLKEKSEALEKFMEYKNFVENQTGKKIKSLQSDNGKEYCSNAFKKYLKENGIQHRLTVPYTPQQNGIAERKNRTLVEMARCLMIQAKLSPIFWAEAIATANFIRNRCISKSIGNETPFKLWHGKVPTVSYFRKFGMRTFALEKTPGRGKFDEKVKECIFIGYSEETKGYRLWSKSDRKVIVSRDVKFMNEYQNNNNYEEILEEQVQNDLQNKDEKKYVHVKLNPEKEMKDEVEGERYIESDDTSNSDDNKEIRGPGRPRILRTGNRGRPRKQYNIVQSNDDEKEEFLGAVEISCKDALRGNETAEWRKAICEEFLSMIKNETWKIVDLPSNSTEIGCRLVLTNKYNLDGTVERRKARLVAKGYNQVHGIDYHETFSPVVRLKSIRVIMALAAQHNLIVHQCDIKTAYLNGEIEEKIYMKIPEQLEESLMHIIANNNEGNETNKIAEKWLKEIQENGKKSCLIQKAIYGLTQSGRQWYKKLHDKLSQFNLKPLKTDSCVYFQRNEKGMMLIAIFVDDIIIAGNSKREINDFKTKLSELF